jgi:hypothetical protein
MQTCECKKSVPDFKKGYVGMGGTTYVHPHQLMPTYFSQIKLVWVDVSCDIITHQLNLVIELMIELSD